MLKKELEEKNQKLKQRIEELESRLPMTKAEIKELIISTVWDNLSFKQDYNGNVSVHIDDNYIGSFSVGEQ